MPRLGAHRVRVKYALLVKRLRTTMTFFYLPRNTKRWHSDTYLDLHLLSPDEDDPELIPAAPQDAHELQTVHSQSELVPHTHHGQLCSFSGIDRFRRK